MSGKRGRLARRRESLGFSQETLAERLNVDVRTVRRWENGESIKGPQPWLRPKLARCLQVSLEQLDELLVVEADADPGPAERSPSRFTMQGNNLNLGAPALDGSLALPITPSGMSGEGGVMRRGTIHPELLHQYETLTNTYRQLDYQVGSGAVYAETVAQLKRMLALADNVPSSLYQRFALALGDSAQLAAWLAIDHQDYGAARHYTALALSSAQEAADPTLHAYVLGIMSYIHLHAGRGPDAVRLLDAALRLAETPRFGVNRAVYSWLSEAMGEAHALAGDPRAGAAALARAERLFDAVDQDDVPPWLGFFNSGEHVTRLKGRCLVKLGDSGAAVATLDEAVAALPAHYVRERSGTLIDLASAHLMPSTSASTSPSDPEAAAATALHAWQLAVETGSGRNQRRIRELMPQFAPYSHHAATQALHAAIG